MVITDSKQILTCLRLIMLKNEVSSKELADKINLSQSALSSRFNQKNISINTLLEMCDALDLEMDINFIKKTTPKS